MATPQGQHVGLGLHTQHLCITTAFYFRYFCSSCYSHAAPHGRQAAAACPRLPEPAFILGYCYVFIES
eukprot:353438-Chlamydomonas_euryale.AAC.13